MNENRIYLNSYGKIDSMVINMENNKKDSDNKNIYTYLNIYQCKSLAFIAIH